MLNTLKIDSLKLRIPRYKVSYVDETFAEEYQKVFIKTGMIEEHVNLDKHKVDVTKGISTRIAVFHSLQGGKAEEQIVIQCNAKQLKQKYFQGITKKTIKDIYSYIINLHIIYVDFETFLDAYVSDIDLCYDVKVTPKAMIEANQEIYRNIKHDCFKYVGKPFRKQTNIGLQFNSREKATPSKPYCKLYHKTTELLYNSNEFAEAFLQGQDYSDIGRIEFCIKNAKHKKYLKLNFQTMRDLLAIDKGTLENVLFSGVLCYVEQKTIMREYKDISPTDRMILYFVNKYVEKGADKQAIFSVLNIYENPQERSRMKKKITQLVEQVDDQERLVANKETMDFLRILKLDL